MKYYAIRVSLNKKIGGIYPQVVHANHNCNVWDETKFIDRIGFNKINFEPIISNAILEKKAKLTDLISAESIGFTSKLLLSDKLKAILTEYTDNKCQFFKAPIIFNHDLINDYWLLNPYYFSMSYVNFKKSSIIVKIRKKEGGTISKSIIVNNLDEFMNVINQHKEKMEIVTIDRVYIEENINDDFFTLLNTFGSMYVVSEKLKNKIEISECTGIEFMPIEMKLTEWLQGEEREKIYGKI
ncbi:hypothetical protein [Olleya marilimosa]|uniref:Uncharacterized protein n=1 Tax=Olleya marilimosa TaxID=272164 RepID=A0ABR8LRB9_9FLAO|nr:hypothetical protein [Olleya marilimosa]MBD3862759.1 hypothetical protein [Olleya marilimosa]